MIFGETPVENALSYIRNSKHEFYLTGSRFFGTQTESSDYDFFVTQSDEVTKELLANGFHLETETYEGDPVLTAVYRRDNVDVQLVRNAKIKQHVQSKMKPMMQAFGIPESEVDKELQKKLWHLCLILYRDGMEGQRDLKLKW